MKIVRFFQDHNIFVLITFMLVVFLNFHFATIKLATLVEHGIESNPGRNYSHVLGVCNSSIAIKNILLCTSYHHVNETSVVQRMGHTESFFTVCFSVKKKVIVWELLDLDFTLNQSYIFIEYLAGSDRYNQDELPLLVKIDNDNFETHRTLHHTDIFHENFINYDNSSRTFEIGDGPILMCAALSFALMWGIKSVYIFRSTCSLTTDHANLLKFGSITEA